MFRLSFCLISLVFSGLLVLGQSKETENAPVLNSQPPPAPMVLPANTDTFKPEVDPAKPLKKPVILLVPDSAMARIKPFGRKELSTETKPTEAPTVKPTEEPTVKPTEAPTTVPTTDPPTPPTPPPPTPAPAPKPMPAPQQGKWFYTDNNNITCIIVQFAAQLNVTYTNTSSALTYALLNVPANATVSGGNCTGAEQWLTLSWPSAAGNSTNNMTLCFNSTADDYQLHALNVSVAAEDLPNAQDRSPLELVHGAEWRTPLRTSYRCAAAAPLNLTAPVRNAAATLALTQLQEEAFRADASRQFSSPRECGGGDVADAVPIAVGCALAGLVAVMLGAYLIGRRRSAAHGYLSM